MAQPPIFLERRSYRKRRMMDAVRLLPLLGLALWMVPLMWSVPQGDAGDVMPMSIALRYVFGIWVSVLLAGWILWLFTRAPQADDNGNDNDDDASTGQTR